MSIVAGIIGLLSSPVMIAYGSVAMLEGWGGFYLFQTGLLFIITGIIAITGGIFALKRRTYWIALAGSFSALICFLFLGIPAVIFVAQSKRSFA